MRSLAFPRLPTPTPSTFFALAKTIATQAREGHSSFHFLLNTATTFLAVILYYSTLSATNRQILTPKRYDEHPRESPPPGYSPLKSMTVVDYNR